jgi:hypothetical protein
MVAVTTRLLATGAMAPAAKARSAFRSAEDTASPAYKSTWGRKNHRKKAPRRISWSRTDASCTVTVNSRMISGAVSIPTTTTAPRPARATPSSDPARRTASSRWPLSMRPTNAGTSGAERSPAANSSNIRFETRLDEW